MWLRNFYNMLTGAFASFTDLSYEDTSVAEQNYKVPIGVHLNNGYWASVNSSIASSYTSDIANNGRNRTNIVLMQSTALSIYKARYNYLGSMPTNASLSRPTFTLSYNDVEASYEDYTTTGWVGGFTLVSSDGATTPTSYDEDTHTYSYTRKFTLNNSSASAQTVNELCIWLSNGTYQQVLVYKDKFDAVTVEPGESLIVEIEYNVPIFNYTPYPTA